LLRAVGAEPGWRPSPRRRRARVAPLDRLRRRGAPSLGRSRRTARFGNRTRDDPPSPECTRRRHGLRMGRSGYRGDPARRLRARVPPRRWTAPRDEVAGERFLHLQRRGPGHRPGERDGLRVLYVDWTFITATASNALLSRSGLMTVSFHESGRSLFPGRVSWPSWGRGVRRVRRSTSRWSRFPARAMAGGGTSACSAPGCVVRAGISWSASHGADGHVWVASTPFSHDHGDGRGGRLVDRMAHDTPVDGGSPRGGGLRRVPSRAASLGVDVAGGRASGGAR